MKNDFRLDRLALESAAAVAACMHVEAGKMGEWKTQRDALTLFRLARAAISECELSGWRPAGGWQKH